MGYIDEVLQRTQRENRNQPEFLQAVEEVLQSLRPVIQQNEAFYRQKGLLERLTTPDRCICFRVTWEDDRGALQVNHGYRVQFNNAIGPYKGGLRFHPRVDLSVMKFLAFEQTFKNALTGLPMGGGKGGADFDPKGRSDGEIMRFCQSFMTELHRYIGPDTDIPAGDIGVGSREIGYLFGQYKRLRGAFDGGITGKAISCGGCQCRTQATGYGLLYLTRELLRSHGHSLEGKTVCVSGAGNVALYAIEKAQQLGAQVVTCSDSRGWIYDSRGIDWQLLYQIKQQQQLPLEDYARHRASAEYHPGKGLWQTKCHIALPCATQNELDLEDAVALAGNGCIAVAEGANMPTTLAATAYLQQQGVLFCPGKAANAGGVATSGLEMTQNSQRQSWSFDRVDSALQDIMANIFRQIDQAARQYGHPGDYVLGANIAGFLKVSDAMLAQGAW